jgi:hypothetical protein
MAATISAEPEAARPDDFSLVLGGPLFQLLRRVRLSDGALGLLHRRVLGAVLVLWAPIFVLAALGGELTGPGRTFLNDIGFQLRFLVTTPLLIIAEPVVHRRLRLLVSEFVTRGLVSATDVPRFEQAIRQAMRLRNSALAEALLLVFVYAGGLAFAVSRYEAMRAPAWYATPSTGGLAPAGWWLVLVSLPLLQFLLLRWALRLLIWARFLLRTARLDLDLDVTHPDRAGGLGFLSDSLAAFAPIAVALGVLFAGMIADRILFAGARLTDFQVQVVSGAVLILLAFAGPLAVFAPQLAHDKRLGLLAYGALGERYVRGFRAKWMGGGLPPDEPLVGSGDIQSLADLGNSYAAAEQTRFLPVRPATLVAFLAAFLAPMLPLLLTTMSLEKLIGQLVGLVL